MVDFARLLADPPLADRRTPESRALAERLLAAVADRGPQSKRALRLAFARGSGELGASAALDRALLDLETRLRLITVDYDEKEGASYDLFARAQRSLAIRAARQTRAESLAYFDDAEADPMLRMLVAVDWEEIKRRLAAEALRIGGLLF